MARIPPALPIAPDPSGKPPGWIEGFEEASQLIIGMALGDIASRETGRADRDPAGVSALLWMIDEVKLLFRTVSGRNLDDDPRTKVYR